MSSQLHAPAWSVARAASHLATMTTRSSPGANVQADGAHLLAVAACRTAAKLCAQQLRVWTSLRAAKSRYEPRKELTSTSFSCTQRIVQHTMRTDKAATHTERRVLLDVYGGVC